MKIIMIPQLNGFFGASISVRQELILDYNIAAIAQKIIGQISCNDTLTCCFVSMPAVYHCSCMCSVVIVLILSLFRLPF